VPRYYKLSFLTFDGREDPLGWLNRNEQFFRLQRTGKGDKVGLAAFHLTSAAQQWYCMLECDTDILTWPHFKVLCQQRFGLAWAPTTWRIWRGFRSVPPSTPTSKLSRTASCTPATSRRCSSRACSPGAFQTAMHRC
jgi:hypothetical protein